jgi:hypothetical protein
MTWHGSAEFTLSEAEGLTTGRNNGASDEVRDFHAGTFWLRKTNLVSKRA